MPSPTETYMASVASEPACAMLVRLRALVLEVAPGAEETTSYGMPAFKLGGSMVWIGAFKRHCSLFVGHTVDAFAERLVGYKTAKGTVQLPLDRPVPEDLVRDLVRARLNC